MELYDVVKKLLGDIEPVAETNEDNRRFKNLKATTELVDRLFTDIDAVATSYKGRHEFSVKRASGFAREFMDDLEAAIGTSKD